MLAILDGNIQRVSPERKARGTVSQLEFTLHITWREFTQTRISYHSILFPWAHMYTHTHAVLEENLVLLLWYILLILQLQIFDYTSSFWVSFYHPADIHWHCWDVVKPDIHTSKNTVVYPIIGSTLIYLVVVIWPHTTYLQILAMPDACTL